MADAALLDRLSAEADGAARLTRALATWRAMNRGETKPLPFPEGRWRQTGEAVRGTDWMWPGAHVLHT
jgi:hypothetical protein